MATTAFKPGSSGSPLVHGGKIVGHVSFGGDMLLMPVGNKTVLFELHYYCGPMPCSKKTLGHLANIPKGFWDAYERWDAGGRLVDGDACVVHDWCRECRGSGHEERHIHGRHYEVVGKCQVCNGSRFEP